MAQRSSPFVTKTIAKDEPKSRQKAEESHKRTAKASDEAQEDWPVSDDGRPLVKISVCAAELLPTGQFANISVGPAQITAFIDPADEEPFSKSDKDNIASALNQLSDIVQVDVIGVQRTMILTSMAEQLAEDSK